MRDTSPDYIVFGRNAAEIVISENPQRILRAYLEEGNRDARGKSLYDALSRLGKVSLVNRAELKKIANTEHHQGVVLMLRPPEMVTLEKLMATGLDRGVLLLDNIQDPQNFGSLLRAAECFGVGGVVWSKNRGCGLTSTAAKVSAGASEVVPLCSVANLSQAVRTLKENGVWIVVSTLRGDAEPLNIVDIPTPWGLVMGAEGEGVSSIIEQQADFRVYVPMMGKVQSLNVSQATSVFLYALTNPGHRHK